MQNGGFMGLLASIGIPLLLNALSGKGLQHRPKSKGLGPQNRPYYDSLMPYQSPPFIGNWPKNTVGMGTKKTSKKKKDKTKKPISKRFTSRKNSPFNSIPLTGAIL